MDGSLFLQSLVLGILLGGLYALLAAGLTLYFGIMRVVMIAHSAFLILAAYLAWFFHRETGIDPLFSLVITVPLFFAVGVLMQRLLVARLRPITLTMMSVLLTFAIALVIEGDARVRLLGHPAPHPARLQRARASRCSARGSRSSSSSRSRSRRPRSPRSTLIMKYTRFGQALRATIQHKEAAQLVGIKTDRVAGYGFGLGLATAAIGGTALALDATIYPSLHWHWIGPLMAIIVVGGLGSIPGAAIAAMVLGIGQSLLQIPMGTTWAQTIFYVALFATLMLRPQGFFGGRLAQRF